MKGLLHFCVWLVLGSSFALHAAIKPFETVLVPMRDSTRLATDIYLPAGTNGSFPVILMRTPYNKSSLVSSAQDGVKRGYAVVIQDTRGRHASEGKNLPYEGDGWGVHWDGYDTAEWVAKQPWCNGKIGTMGGSALSNAHFLLMGSGSDKISAEHHQVGSPSLFHDVIFPGGVFKKFLIEEWLTSQKYSPEALQTWTRHPGYDDYWKTKDARSQFHRANAPAVHIGGWYDIFAQATLDAFNGYQTNGRPRAHGKQRLIMGPWSHSIFTEKAGELVFPGAKQPPMSAHDPWRWFEKHLQGVENGVDQEPAVIYYTMGDPFDPSAPGNEWRTSDAWPPSYSKDTEFYFTPHRGLNQMIPYRANPLTYRYDPAHPVPTIGGYQNPPPNGPMDQQLIEKRADVLSFTSQPLKEPMEVTGRVTVHLYVSSDCPDTDFFARLCDVHPDGRSFNICEGQVRARYRHGQDKEVFLKPGRVHLVKIDLWSTSMIFNKGHRFRVHVTSSSYPGFDPNPNTGRPFRADSKQRVATNGIHVGGDFPSHIILPVVE